MLLFFYSKRLSVVFSFGEVGFRRPVTSVEARWLLLTLRLWSFCNGEKELAKAVAANQAIFTKNINFEMKINTFLQ